jgi:hypothetical protein
MKCRCGKTTTISVTFKSPKKTFTMCVHCANKHYMSLTKGHNYKIVKIEEHGPKEN